MVLHYSSECSAIVYLHYVCLFAHSGVQHILLHVSFLVSFIGLCNFHFEYKFLVFVLFIYAKRLE